MLFRLICSVLISSLLLSNLFVFGQITQIPQSVSGGSAGAGKFAATVSSSTTWTVLGTTHNLTTADIGVFVSFDSGTSYVSMGADECSVHKTTYDVTCTFSVAQAGRILLVGGTGGSGGGGDEYQANKNQNNGYMGLDSNARAAKVNQHGQTVYADQTITWASRTGFLAMALGALGLPSGTSLPGSCSSAEIFIDTDATSGQRLYVCESGTWVLQGDGGGGGGGVSSVGLTMPAEFSVSGSPVTSSGTLAVSKANQNANLGFFGPTSGGAAAPTFRALVGADLPVMVGDSGSGGTKGAVPAPSAGDTVAGKYLRADGTWAVPAGGGGTAAVWLTTIVADLDLASLTTACEAERTTTVSGATVGWPAFVVPPAGNPHNMTFPARVTAPNTVKWAGCAIGTANADIGSYVVYVIPPTV